MFATPALAQAQTTVAPGAGSTGPFGGGSDILISILPFVAVFAIMYFLIIRPQRAQIKSRTDMLKNIRRGDTVVTGGGIIAKVTKVMDNGELEVQIAEQVRIRVMQATVSEVRVKGEPMAANTK